jgi:hypothetical protein
MHFTFIHSSGICQLFSSNDEEDGWSDVAVVFIGLAALPRFFP